MCVCECVSDEKLYALLHCKQNTYMYIYTRAIGHATLLFTLKSMTVYNMSVVPCIPHIAMTLAGE